MWTALQLLGAVLLVAGVALLSIPAALIVAGVGVFAVGFMGEG